MSADEIQVLVECGGEVAEALVVAGLSGHTVEDQGDDETVFGVGEARRALSAAVAEGVLRTMKTVAVGDGPCAVLL